MADESTQSIIIKADPSVIMAVIADFAHYPEWTGSVKQATVVDSYPDGRARRVAFRLDAGVVRDSYELDYVWSDDARVDWTLASGQMMKAQRGCYVLTPQADRTTLVTYMLAVELAIPMLGLLKRKAERIVLDTALKQLKRRVETTRV
jgi:ribosome-associated toxin RatA of RatAB toxin-antitoxin module